MKHVLFDCDGTIVDSEIIAARAMLRLLAEHGLHLSEKEYNVRYPGLRSRDIVEALEREQGFCLPNHFFELLREGHRDGFHRSLKAVPGMDLIFKGLKVPKSMVSNGSVDHVEKCLCKVQLRSALDGHIFSAEQVKKPKPAPDVYRHAIEVLKMRPHETLVVEDSVTGVKAAKSAGLFTLGFLGAAHICDGHADKLMEAGADLVFPDAAALALFFREKGLL